jgi:hypothetical protein
MMACFGRKLLAWTAALGLSLVVVILLVATGESIRHTQTASLPTESVEADHSLGRPTADDTYHPSGLAAWPTQ